jgi:hypothetical protein
MAKAGRPEILTEQLARQICRMIQRMPDAQIPVDWDNVIAHAKKRFKHSFNRQMLSQKEWNGRPIIAEAFSEAKKVQKRMQNDSAPKYRTASRAVQQSRIMEQDAMILALKEELEEVRAQKVDILDTFLNTGCDLPKLLDMARKQRSQGETIELRER